MRKGSSNTNSFGLLGVKNCLTKHFQPTNEKKSGQHQHFLSVGSKKLLGPTLLTNKRGIGLLKK